MKELLTKMLQSKDVWWGPLTFVLTIALCFFGFVAIIKHTNLEAAGMVIAGLMSQLGTLINYRYGASKKQDQSTNTK